MCVAQLAVAARHAVGPRGGRARSTALVAAIAQANSHEIATGEAVPFDTLPVSAIKVVGTYIAPRSSDPRSSVHLLVRREP